MQVQTLLGADGDGRGGGRSERWDPVGLAYIKNMESKAMLENVPPWVTLFLSPKE